MYQLTGYVTSFDDATGQCPGSRVVLVCLAQVISQVDETRGRA